MDWLDALDPHWGWLIAGVLLAAAEMVVPGVFLIWLGLAAIVTGVLTLAVGLPFAGQLATFAAVAVLTVVGARRWIAANPPQGGDPLLNDRAGKLVGEIVTVCEAIDHGRGRVKVADGVWNARGPDAPVGARLRVVGIEDGALVVLPPTRPDPALPS